ncbi:hypothetical protein GOP47_0019523 [Adiantum capillus-veneris]|uniref:Origin recognition complex subunit 5 n=1 Tax=Adiantum capillus-veneris TaxID=13818 RepID=A0A9D4UB72_ADICA|nr:hypothetical protein GOP47_0019523 [Adiantum capillus-veneris]
MRAADGGGGNPICCFPSGNGSSRVTEGNALHSPNSKAGETSRRTRSRAASPLKAAIHQSHSQHEGQHLSEEAWIAPDMLYSHLVDRFPARNSEINQLLGLLGEPCDLLFPLFVYGGASTGFLIDACTFAVSDKAGSINKGLVSPQKKKGYRGEERDGSLPVVYLIFDNVELLLDWSGGFRLISALVRLSEFSGLENLGLIFISSLGPDAFFSGTGLLEAIPIYMRDYADDDLHQILLKEKPNRALYSAFLSAVLKPFSRVTRRVTELSEALEPLFQKYTEPIRRGTVKPDDQGKRKLFSFIQPHVTSALHQTCSLSFSANSLLLNGQKKISADHLELDFQLSLCSKYLLISAFICSRNPATLDATFFDSSGGSSKKRRRRSSQTAVEKKELERQEKLLKGPGTFPLERLLAIFCCISADFADELDEIELTSMDQRSGVEMSSDVLMQVSTLVNANLLYRGSSDLLEGAPRYRCNASDDLIQAVSRSVNFPLSRYLYRM